MHCRSFPPPPPFPGPGLEEAQGSQVPPASSSAGHYVVADTPSLASQHPPRSDRGSSTSSGEDYCNSPSSRLPLWTPQAFSTERSPFLEQPPNLELAGSQATFSGKLGPGGYWVCPQPLNLWLTWLEAA